MDRFNVYLLIDGERDYQDTLSTDPLSVAGELLLLEDYIAAARKKYVLTFHSPEEQPTMDFIRKVAAIAVRAIEHHGAPQRTVPGEAGKAAGK